MSTPVCFTKLPGQNTLLESGVLSPASQGLAVGPAVSTVRGSTRGPGRGQGRWQNRHTDCSQGPLCEGGPGGWTRGQDSHDRQRRQSGSALRRGQASSVSHKFITVISSPRPVGRTGQVKRFPICLWAPPFLKRTYTSECLNGALTIEQTVLMCQHQPALPAFLLPQNVLGLDQEQGPLAGRPGLARAGGGPAHWRKQQLWAGGGRLAPTPGLQMSASRLVRWQPLDVPPTRFKGISVGGLQRLDTSI